MSYVYKGQIQTSVDHSHYFNMTQLPNYTRTYNDSVGWPAIQIVPRHPTPLFIVVMATLSASGIQVMHRIDYVGVMKYTRLYSLTVTYVRMHYYSIVFMANKIW